MTRLGSSPPPVCTCGHPHVDHDSAYGCSECICPIFELDEDR